MAIPARLKQALTELEDLGARVDDADSAELAAIDEARASLHAEVVSYVPDLIETLTDISHLLITRINGKSASRRQRRYAGAPAIDRGIKAARKRGATVFWHYGPPAENGRRPLLNHWTEPKDT